MCAGNTQHKPGRMGLSSQRNCGPEDEASGEEAGGQETLSPPVPDAFQAQEGRRPQRGKLARPGLGTARNTRRHGRNQGNPSPAASPCLSDGHKLNSTW